MKKKLFVIPALLLVMCMLSSCFFSLANLALDGFDLSDLEAEDLYSIDDMTLEVGESAAIPSFATKLYDKINGVLENSGIVSALTELGDVTISSEMTDETEYTFDGDCISIENGVVTALKEGTVIVSAHLTEKTTTVFTVTVVPASED